MNTPLFGINWENSELTSGQFGEIYYYSHPTFGRVYITDYANDECQRNISFDKNYIYQAILREKYLNNTAILICDEKETEKVQGFKNGKCEILQLQSMEKFFPQKITDIEKRTLLNLSKINSSYGTKIENINTFDCYAKNNRDLIFILDILKNKNQIDHSLELTNNHQLFMTDGILIKENGWIAIENYETFQNSNQAFVAMWFDENMLSAYQKIKQACFDNKFSAFRIDYKEHNNEISGEILAEIRKSRFLIADVTGQRQGVYFEAGYALALGIPVIWSCKKTDLNNVHFDTRQYNHVVWENENDLYTRMNNRIKGTIGE